MYTSSASDSKLNYYLCWLPRTEGSDSDIGFLIKLEVVDSSIFKPEFAKVLLVTVESGDRMLLVLL